VCHLEGAHSTEFDPGTPYPVIDLLPDQKHIREKGGTMRLGAYEAVLKKGTLVSNLYHADSISERHRHRFEVNPEYHKILTDEGLVLSGTSRDGRLVEFIELPNLYYFVATQAHPELKSRMEKPSPLFYGFVQACMKVE
jgi:CTP synthase